MASPKKLGFFCGEDKVTLVEFEKNVPLQVVSAPIAPNTETPSPFSSNLTEEIQLIAVLKKMLQDHQIKGGSFYVSLPMKEIVLRSFVIPFVKQENINDAIKFEAKKYIPFEIQDLSYVFHTIPFTEGQSKRFQVIFFAARKEVWDRYERIFKQVNIEATYCEPYIVSLSKSLLYRKEIKPTEHLAFLILDKNLGRICFIDHGIPQFIREFTFGSISSLDEANESQESLNLKIVTEVLNSFDFYARQFSGDPIVQVLISSSIVQQELMDALEAELKVKITKYSPVISAGVGGQQSDDMDAIYAMGACVAPPMESLSKFNFIGDKTVPKTLFENELVKTLLPFKKTILAFLMSLVFLGVLFAFFQVQLNLANGQFVRLSSKEGAFSNEPQSSIEAELELNADKLNQYKAIRIKSNNAEVILILATHLPVGALLTSLSISYDQGDPTITHMNIDLHGDVVVDDPNEQIAIVNQVYSDLKNDKALSKYVSTVNLVSFNPEQLNGRQVTGFNIHCS